MSRLIDADVFEKFIKEKYKDGESTDDIKDQMLFDLSYQPTAYDVDKVVEELKKEKDKLYNARNELSEKMYTDKSAFNRVQVLQAKELSIHEAIEIVKEVGGMNESSGTVR